MIFGFFKKLIKYYIDKLVHWLRMQKFNLELDNEIEKKMPKVTGPMVEMSSDTKEFWDYIEKRNKEYVEWETKGKWEQ